MKQLIEQKEKKKQSKKAHSKPATSDNDHHSSVPNQSIHQKKQPSFNDEDLIEELSIMEDEEMQIINSLKLSILSPSTVCADQNHHHDTLDNWTTRYRVSSLHHIPVERGEWLRLDGQLLKEREQNTNLITSHQNAKRNNEQTSHISPTRVQQSTRLIESENELAVDQFDMVVQLCTKMVFSVVTSSPLCCPRVEIENEMNHKTNGHHKNHKTLMLLAKRKLAMNSIDTMHRVVLRKKEEISWRKFIEIVFLKLIVDPKVIVVGLHYFQRVISLLEKERHANSPLFGRNASELPSSSSNPSLTPSFNRNELKTIICVCVMLASKMYDEDNYWKSKTYYKLFSSLCRKREDHRRISYKEFNQLEVEILNILQFNLVLNMDEFGKDIIQRYMKVHFDDEMALLMI